MLELLVWAYSYQLDALVRDVEHAFESLGYEVHG